MAWPLWIAPPTRVPQLLRIIWGGYNIVRWKLKGNMRYALCVGSTVEVKWKKNFSSSNCRLSIQYKAGVPHPTNIVNISVFNALSIDSGLVAAVGLCIKRSVNCFKALSLAVISERLVDLQVQVDNNFLTNSLCEIMKNSVCEGVPNPSTSSIKSPMR